jgi:hypothetical protein
MKSETTGDGIWGSEVLNVSPHGFWLLVSGREYFLDSDKFPWFRQATVTQLFAVELLRGNQLHWPLLDVDLDLDRIEPIVIRWSPRARLKANPDERFHFSDSLAVKVLSIQDR